MALKITLKPNEKIILGNAVLTNGNTKAVFVVENNVPILRQKNILRPDEADTPAKRIYCTIQLMYIDEAHLPEHHKLYWELVGDFINALPRSLPLIDQVNEFIVKNDYYKALKLALELIDFEQEVIQSAEQCCESLPGC